MLNNILFFIMKTKLIIYFFLFSFINSKLWNLDSMFQYAKNNLTLGFEDYGIFNPDNLLTYEETEFLKKVLKELITNLYIFPYIYIINRLDSKDLSDEYLFNLTDSFISKLETTVIIGNKDYTLIILLIEQNKKMYIYIGKSLLTKIPKENCKEIINYISKDLQNKKYFKAIQFTLYNISFLYEDSLNLNEIDDENKSKSDKGKEFDDELIEEKNSDNKKDNFIYIIIIGILLFILIFTICFCLKLAKKLRNVSSSLIDYQIIKI